MKPMRQWQLLFEFEPKREERADDLLELVAEHQRHDDINEWRQTELIEACFLAGYLAGRNGIPEAEAWSGSVVKRIQDTRRAQLAKPVSLDA
jgi:hypothetical protein